MSMTAVFVQVDADELRKIEANPALAEALFHSGPAMPMVFGELSKKMEERVRASGPQLLAATLGNLDPRLREQLEARLGGTAQQFAAGQGGEALLKVMQERRERAMGVMQTASKQRPKLSLAKEWHGLHYLLCGEVESGESILSKAVLGGKILGDDDEGFSGYGPARFLEPREVVALHEALSQPDLESEARGRFDAAKMNKLQIYPGWRAEDVDELLTSFHNLREFYANATTGGKAIVTCLM
jgi:hypothetical protein